MYLPVLLVRDWGFWAFVVFALPNVIGAAAMPWVVRSATASREMVARHAGPMLTFSRVTIVFQAFFAGWMLPQLVGWWTLTIYPVLIGCLLFAAKRDRDFFILTALTWLISLVAGLVLASWGVLSVPAAKGIDGAAMLAPVCLLGFLLCPYLDLTFHHALQRAEDERPGSARPAFALGFGVVFASMIAFTLLYAGVLLQLDSASAGRVVGVHLMLQLIVTALLHQVRSGVLAAEVARATGPNLRMGKRAKPAKQPGGGPPLMVLLAGGFAAGLAAYFVPPLGGWPAGEYVYRAFFVFYGLLFPAYVLFRMVPREPGSFRVLGVTVLMAMPLYAAGFYTMYPLFLGAGTAVVLFGWMVSGLRPPTARVGAP